MAERTTRKLGDTIITRVMELELRNFSPGRLFPDLAGDAGDLALFPDELKSVEGNLILSSHSWLVRGRKRTILVDTGAGAGKARPYAPYFDHLDHPFLERLAEEGVAPGDVDYVLLTHLHVDHVGWNTIPDGDEFKPTFPNARYVFSGEEYAFFSAQENHTERNRTSFMARADSVDPVVRSGQALMVPTDGGEILPGIRFLPTPGHSPYHASISVDLGNAIALFAGDTLHHQAQVLRPDVNSIFDADSERARQSRRLLLEHASLPGTTTFGAHLAGTSVIRIEGQAGGFTWIEA
jgi:glyoxylase-like metal-dependent hydrolase (beta-lactamase superfamily II)